MKKKTIENIVNFIRWLVVCLLYISDILQPTPEKPHTGGESILPHVDALKLQPAVVAVLGEKKALIVQKLHEWLMVNQKNGTHKFDGATWTYGSHQDWHDRHFNWFSKSYLGKLLKELVDDGFLIATDEAPFCYKGQFAYRPNYVKISESIDWQKVQHPPAKSATPPCKKCETTI